MCRIVFRVDSGNSRKIVSFTYNCLYARPFKAVNVDNVIRNSDFYYFIKFMMLQQKNDIDHISVRFMPLTVGVTVDSYLEIFVMELKSLGFHLKI